MKKISYVGQFGSISLLISISIISSANYSQALKTKLDSLSIMPVEAKLRIAKGENESNFTGIQPIDRPQVDFQSNQVHPRDFTQIQVCPPERPNCEGQGCPPDRPKCEKNPDKPKKS